jgi:hypothetical protein
LHLFFVCLFLCLCYCFVDPCPSSRLSHALFVVVLSGNRFWCYCWYFPPSSLISREESGHSQGCNVGYVASLACFVGFRRGVRTAEAPNSLLCRPPSPKVHLKFLFFFLQAKKGDRGASSPFSVFFAFFANDLAERGSLNDFWPEERARKKEKESHTPAGKIRASCVALGASSRSWK